MLSTPTIKGFRLEPNQTVGIIAPASPVSKSEIMESLQLVESFPLKVRLGNHLFDRLSYLAGSDHDRVSDLHQMFSDPEIKAIFCARGGYGSARLLDKVDFDLIRENPKVLVGFSDLTALLIALYKKCRLITIHGPTLSDLPRGKNWQHLSRLITTSRKPRISLSRGKAVNKGKARGTLLGGNLSTICSLLDTPFLPSFDSVILFLEEKGESPYRVDRMLTQLLLSGRLAHLSALVIAQMEDCGEQEILYSLLQERLGTLSVPMVTGLPVGHGDENISIPLGLPALLDSDRMVLEVEESATS
ncbi:MAG: LD-carboxypeptidase [Deltaproteobacteria bacterium]|nr:LD-carboxypeptidase [Deltaproteobacteria bacterium]MBW2339842.1 LD-carboxypeptidase [Deltaproteobacteria bacterium]